MRQASTEEWEKMGKNNIRHFYGSMSIFLSLEYSDTPVTIMWQVSLQNVASFIDISGDRAM